MNKTSRFLTLGISALIGLSALVSCDKEIEQNDPEGTGIFVISNMSSTNLFYFPEGTTTDTVVIGEFAVEPIVVYKSVNSQATPTEYFLQKALILYKFDDDSLNLVETFKQYPVSTTEWVSQKKDALEFGVTQYTLLLDSNMLY